MTLRYNVTILDVEDPDILKDAIECDLHRLGIKGATVGLPMYDVGDVIEVRIDMKPRISIKKVPQEL